MADAIDERAAAVPGDRVRHGPGGADVVEDVGARRLLQDAGGEQRRHEVAGHELAVAVDEEAAVGVAVPGDAQVGAGLADLGHDELAVLGQQRVGLVVGELAVGLPVGLDQLERQPAQDRADHRAGHAVAAVEHDLQRPDRRGVDRLQRPLLEGRVDVGLLAGAAARGGTEAVLDVRADLGEAAVAGQRDAAAPDQLRARVGLRVVRGGAHQAAVEAARPDEPVEHLGAHHPGVDHVRALGHQPVAVAAGQLGGGEPHVAPQPDAQLVRALAGQLGERARQPAPDRLRRVAVDVAPVEAADVVGLEDLRQVRHRHARGA